MCSVQSFAEVARLFVLPAQVLATHSQGLHSWSSWLEILFYQCDLVGCLRLKFQRVRVAPRGNFRCSLRYKKGAILVLQLVFAYSHSPFHHSAAATSFSQKQISRSITIPPIINIIIYLQTESRSLTQKPLINHTLLTSANRCKQLFQTRCCIDPCSAIVRDSSRQTEPWST